MKILLNFSHADKSSEANSHKQDKRIVNWHQLMHAVYCLYISSLAIWKLSQGVRDKVVCILLLAIQDMSILQ